MSKKPSSKPTVGHFFEEEEERIARPANVPVATAPVTNEDLPRASLIRIPPFSFIHVLNTNNNVAKLEVGPKSFTCLDHEKVVFGPSKMIIIPPRSYAVIANPVITENGVVVKDKHGQAKLRHGDSEIRFDNEPFALYPGETMTQISQLKIVEPNQALRLRALRDFTDKYAVGKPAKRKAGDEWLFEGPGTYLPQVEVEIVELVASKLLLPNQALHLKARREFVDRTGKSRKAGEEWLVRTEGTYLPGVEEIVVSTITGHILEKNKTALHLRALRTFVDEFGKERKAGEEWLVTYDDHEVHIPDVFEQVVSQVLSITLQAHQFCTIIDPVDDAGKPQLGHRKIVRGENHFFLQPGERLSDQMIQNCFILSPDEALLVRASEGFTEHLERRGVVRKRDRKPGDRWYIYGPGDYVPPYQVQVLDRRHALIRLEGLGIYMFYSLGSLILFVILAVLISLAVPRIIM